MELRPLGLTDIRVSPIALGCWPIAGMSSADVNDADSLATIEACFDLGINFLDTAYGYGPAGESERLICRALGSRRDEMAIASKGGLHWEPGRQQIVDGRPERLKLECEESLRRLGTDRIELLYLHAPDPKIPLTDSAGALRELLQAGKTRAVGASNVSLAQLQEFAAVCPVTAVQPPYNMLQRDIDRDLIPWCISQNISVVIYWPLLKGLLAGKIPRGHVFPTTDSRHKYPMFQGSEWEKNQDLMDRLRPIAEQAGRSLAQVAINWAIHRPGITAALCGAKRPDQIRENALAAGWKLSPNQLAEIEAALAARGKAAIRQPV